MLRIGLGYDLHRLVYGNRLVIGGVQIEHDYGCLAHSDGDVLVHALIDALLSPVGGGDIGVLFPDTDPKWKGAKSTDLLKVVKDLKLKNCIIQNLDCVLIVDRPKISPHVSAMKKVLADILDIREDQISIKGKTTENTRIFTVECYVNALVDVVSVGA